MLRSMSGYLRYWWVLPLAPLGLVLLWLVWPAFDPRLPTNPDSALQNPVHFWLITAAGLLCLGISTQMGSAASRRNDARVFLIALSVLNSSAALLLHALATPTMLIPERNVGFILAAPVGMLLSAVFAAASATRLVEEQASTIMAYQGILRSGVIVFWVIFGGAALLQLPPFAFLPSPDVVQTPLMFCIIGQTPLPTLQFPVTAMLLVGTALSGWTTYRYLQLYRQRRTVVLLGLVTTFALLTLVILSVGLSRTWHASWWLWHALIVVAYGLLAYSIYHQFRQEGSTRIIFDSLYLEETIKTIRQEYTSALETLVAAFQQRAQALPDGTDEPVAAQVAERFGLSSGQTQVLEQAAAALAGEREQISRLGALVAIGQESSVILDEAQLLQRALILTNQAFQHDQINVALVQEGHLQFMPQDSQPEAAPLAPLDAERCQTLRDQALQTAQPVEDGRLLIIPLLVKGHGAGVLEVQRRSGSFAERDRWLLRSLATQLSIALENTRLYRQIDALFRQYMPASVATTLLADPSQAALGGAVREISVLFADLRGFTTVSERMSPPQLVALLNRYYGVASQVVLEQGGTIDKFMGDAMMALFNAPVYQPDHALRAARAALAMQRVIAPITAESRDMPQFGIGINTGEALVGNIGSESIRNFTAIGDTVNLASRLQTRADGGKVLISSSTYAQIKDVAEVQSLGMIQVKGKQEPLEAYVLIGLRE